MSSRFTRFTFFAAAASLLLSGPMAMAKGDPACDALKNSFRAAPEWFAARCASDARTPEPVSTEHVVPGDTAFYTTFFAASVATAPLPTLNFSNLGPGLPAMFGMAFNNSATILYGLDQDSRQLGTINQTTGAFTPIAAMNPDPGLFVTGLSNDPTSSTMYVTLVDGIISNLYTIDVNTATLTLVGTITGFPLVIDIKVDNSGQMYGMDIGVDSLISINKATAVGTVVGPIGFDANFAQGMMYDPSDDTLYGCAYDLGLSQMKNVVYNRTTGAATVVAGPIAEEAECAVRVATGPCTGPLFSGLASATSAGTPACAINLDWAPATACGPTTLTYNVYRSTVAGTPPSAATLLQSCLTTTDYTDTTATGGTRYYYIVRAEDNTTGGTGPCNGGVTDTNTAERSAVAGGPTTTTTDDVEAGGANWDTTVGSGAGAPWAIVTTESHSPTHSWFTPDPGATGEHMLTTVNAVAFPPAGGTYSWWHRYDTETNWDGYVFEYSLDNGATWTDILAGNGPVPANTGRFLQNGYVLTLNTSANPIGGRRAWSGTIAAFQEVRVDMTDFGGMAVKLRFRFGADGSVPGNGVFVDDISAGATGSCNTVPTQAAAAEALAVDTAGNGVYQPNETVVVAPTWRNTGATVLPLVGTLANHTGPAGPTYSIPDNSASYGSIAVGGTASCGSNCYAVANTATTRPATHWDTTADETVTPTTATTTKTWTLHVGDSFADVPASNGFYRFIETILHKNVTGGCTATNYCPSADTTRDQMAVFVLVSKEPAGYVPPACGATPMFTDVPVSSGFCRWVEELANRGVVGGCAPNLYCPDAPATREQMAVFVLRTLDPALNPPACTTPMFNDVPASSGFCRWIEELARRGVVTGCGGGNYCPTAAVTREQMGVFLAVTFSISLYGL